MLPWEKRFACKLATYVAAAVTTFVALEVFRVAVPALAWLFAGVRILTVIAVVRVVMSVDVAVEVGGAMEPGACSDEDAAGEPLRAVVTVRGAAVGRGFVVAVRACGSGTDAYADLGLSLGRGRNEETQTGCSR
jgi:hypothetical protein